MKLAVLTTETPHHAFFVRETAGAANVGLVVVERRQPRFPFETHHPFEDERDAYERQAWFAGTDVRLQDLAPTLETESANAAEVVARLTSLGPDMVVVFGTGKLSPAVIRACPPAMLNLHGGDPEEYRGLDTHLWTIYHGDFARLVTTLHRVNADLDDGEIVSQAAVPITPGMKLHELRRRNTEVCVRLVLAAMDIAAAGRPLPSRPQQRRGRYYSAMPAPLKEICRTRFESYTSKLA